MPLKGSKRGPGNLELKNVRISTKDDVASMVDNQIKSNDTSVDEYTEEQKLKMQKFNHSKAMIGVLKHEDLTKLEDIGVGIGGVVEKVVHNQTKIFLARKLIKVDVSREKQTSIIRECNILQKCHSPYIVGYYGCYLNGTNLAFCMEFMSAGSLNFLLEKAKRIPENIIAVINASVLKGLVAMRNMKLIHRDIKPSNILLNDEGDVKLCDFGVSGVLVDSVANSFVGTRSYMAPERLSGKTYSAKSDVWSLGLTLIELATGRYPYPQITEAEYDLILGDNRDPQTSIDMAQHLPFFTLLSHIVGNTPPSLPTKYFSSEFRIFVSCCMVKDPEQRCDFDDLRKTDFFVQHAREDSRILANWIRENDALL